LEENKQIPKSRTSFKVTALKVHAWFLVRFTLTREAIMLRWAILFFIVAVIAAVFGFGGVAGEAAWIGKVLLVVFLILAVISVVLGRRGPSVG
jgi:uncharacterized membrane protein YtjA (UPF0391 family)